MARGRKTGGRQKGSRNRATEEARAAAHATGILPLDYMLMVMGNCKTDNKRREAMAVAAAPYLHSKLNPAEPKLYAEPDKPKVVSSIEVRFVRPRPGHEDDDDAD